LALVCGERADGSEEHWLGVGSGPVWSPDGRWLTFGYGSVVWLTEVDTWRLQLVALPASAQIVAWGAAEP
jgi:hypothetical protein